MGEDLENIRANNEMLLLHVDTVLQSNEQNSDNINVMEHLVEALKSNNKTEDTVCGLPEHEPNTESLINLVVNNVFKVDAPNDNLSADQISQVSGWLKKGISTKDTYFETQVFEIDTKRV